MDKKEPFIVTPEPAEASTSVGTPTVVITSSREFFKKNPKLILLGLMISIIPSVIIKIFFPSIHTIVDILISVVIGLLTYLFLPSSVIKIREIIRY